MKFKAIMFLKFAIQNIHSRVQSNENRWNRRYQSTWQRIESNNWRTEDKSMFTYTHGEDGKARYVSRLMQNRRQFNEKFVTHV